MTDLEEQLQRIESKLDLIINELILKGRVLARSNLCLDPVTKKFDPSDMLNACCCDMFDKKENNNE